MNILLLIGSTVIGLLLVESSFRALWHNPYRDEKPDHLLKLPIHHPLTDYIISRRLITEDLPPTRLRTDDRSYIIPSKQYKDADYTIAFLGGSTTACTAVAESLRFHTYVSTVLKQHGLRVNALNIARAGNSVHDALNILLNHVILDNPDIAVLMHACNDIGVLKKDPVYRSRMGEPVNIIHQMKWLGQMLSNHSWIVAFIRYRLTHRSLTAGFGFSPREGNVPEEQFRNRLRAFISLCRSFEMIPVLMTQPAATFKNKMTPDWLDLGLQDQFNQVIREMGREENVLVIDLIRYVRKELLEFNKPSKVFYDGLHFTDYGSMKCAEYISEIIYREIINPGLETMGRNRRNNWNFE